MGKSQSVETKLSLASESCFTRKGGGIFSKSILFIGKKKEKGKKTQNFKYVD